MVAPNRSECVAVHIVLGLLAQLMSNSFTTRKYNNIPSAFLKGFYRGFK